MLSILRFWRNEDEENSNRLFSRTLGKIAFIHTDYQGPAPQSEEFWVCAVTEEVCAGQVKGCFLVHPTAKVKYESLRSLDPNGCTIHIYNFCPSDRKGGMTCVVTPIKQADPSGNLIPWFLQLRYKAELRSKDVVAIVPNLGGAMWTLR